MKRDKSKLIMLARGQYRGINRDDPLRFYYWPVIGRMYRDRVELCLNECRGGERVLEVGFGSGLSFINLSKLYKEIHGIDLNASIEEIQTIFDGMGIYPVLKNGNVLDLPYAAETFDTVLLISILEHLKPSEQLAAFTEISRVLKSGGQVVYGVPVERPFMVFMFRLINTDIRAKHFSTEKDIFQYANQIFSLTRLVKMRGPLGLFGQVYEVGHFIKPDVKNSRDDQS